MAIEPILSTSTYHPSYLYLDEGLKKHQDAFDDLDIFTALGKWAIGIPLSTAPHDGMKSYENNLGIKADQLLPLGLIDGRYLRKIGVDSDILFFCERLENADSTSVEPIICAIIQHITEKMQIWADHASKEETESWLNELQEFPTRHRSASEIRELCNKLLEIYHCLDLKILRSHIHMKLSSPCTSSSEPISTARKVDQIVLQFELLELLENTSIHSNPDMIQVALIQIREECTMGSGEALIKRIYQHTRNLHQQKKKDVSKKRYGCYAFLEIEGCKTTLTDKIEVIHRTRATLLLPVIKRAITHNQTEDLQRLLPLLKKIKFHIHSSSPKTSLDTLFYQTLWIAAHRPATDPLVYGPACLTNSIPLDLETKITAINQTIERVRSLINK